MQQADKREVFPLDVLVALMSETDSPAVYFLSLQSVSRYDVLRAIAHGPDEGKGDEGADFQNQSAQDKNAEPNDALGSYTVNLNAEVLAGRIDPLIGRKHEMERRAGVVPPPQNNPLLVGEAGAGKTALAEGFGAPNCQRPGVGHFERRGGVFARHGRIAGGHQHRGDFEARVKAVLKQLATIPNAVLFVAPLCRGPAVRLCHSGWRYWTGG